MAQDNSSKITFKVSKVDYNLIRREAQKNGQTMSEFIRWKILDRVELKKGGTRYKQGKTTYNNISHKK